MIGRLWIEDIRSGTVAEVGVQPLPCRGNAVVFGVHIRHEGEPRDYSD